MDRAEFRETLASLDDEDQDGLVEAIRRRVSTLSGRHLDIQRQIDESDDERRSLEAQLAAVESEIVSQVDDAVDEPVESIEDVENLPADANVQFDPELVAKVERIRTAARENHQRTSATGSDLQSELDENTAELELYGDVLAEVEEEDLPTSRARERLLAHLDDE